MFAGGEQWYMTKDQVKDLVRISSHNSGIGRRIQSYGQLKATHKCRRAQCQKLQAKLRQLLVGPVLETRIGPGLPQPFQDLILELPDHVREFQDRAHDFPGGPG